MNAHKGAKSVPEDQVAELAEASVNTVRVVRRALVARGEVLCDAWRRAGESAF